jgi:hypothetical protein
MGRTMLHGKDAESAQLDTVAALQGGRDLAQNGVDDVLHVTLIKVAVLRGDALHKLGFYHRCCLWPSHDWISVGEYAHLTTSHSLLYPQRSKSFRMEAL